MENTLEHIRHILTVENTNKLLTDGPKEAGTEIRVLRKNQAGYYLPCLGHIERVTPSGRFTVLLWEKKNERVTVSAKAVLWPVPDSVMTIGKAYDLLPFTERTMLKHRSEYPFQMLNDFGEPCSYRVVHDGVELGIVVYYQGRKLVCHERKAA